ncbi:MAG: DNA polymerase III subunit gamma/tau [Paracoccaceae bacterium]|nr:DNA polymerase III subunit gamma/tau [Paracoccaceae bacterium]
MNTNPDTGYRVLARTYRPQKISDLLGQEPTVRTLRNAFESNRIAHAFLMTGVRGVGKTTTARIIAKGLNCIGLDGKGGPTVEPCGACDSCRSVAEGRHVDVIEMDAASRTGVADVRTVIEAAQYGPAMGRYKVYIIDEVHMLSTQAFNALLKTLEEPPDHVKFIFATTEIRKVPVTILSRCQRYDLRRIEPDVMTAHLKWIAQKEGVEVADDALALVTRAAEGSVRDAQSILDPVVARREGRVTASDVRAILGLADRSRALDLFDLIVRGDAAGALREFGAQYDAGADPLAILRELAEVIHWISVVKVSPDAAKDPSVSPVERDRGLELSGTLDLRILTRLWQLALKALNEVAAAPIPRMAADMAIIRMTHVAELPTPDELIRKLQDQRDAERSSTPRLPLSTMPPQTTGALANDVLTENEPDVDQPGALAVPGDVAGDPASLDGSGGDRVPGDQAQDARRSPLDSFSDVVELIRASRDITLLIEIENSVRLVRYSPGYIEFEPANDSRPDLVTRLVERLEMLTGERWTVVLSQGGGRTIREEREFRDLQLRREVEDHPMVKAVFDAFPGATIAEIRERPAPSPNPARVSLRNRQTERPESGRLEPPEKRRRLRPG